MLKLSKDSNELTIKVPMDIVKEAMEKGASSLNIKLDLGVNDESKTANIDSALHDNYPSQSGVEALSMRF